MRQSHRFLIPIVLLLTIQPTTAQNSSPTVAERRLCSLSRLWGTLKYFHPYLTYRNVDWDSAFASAVPRVLAARDANEYAESIQTMLASLDDPVTRVLPRNHSVSDSVRPARIDLETTPDSIVVFRVNNYNIFANVFKVRQYFLDAAKRLRTARGLVIDLRSFVPLAESEQGMLNYLFETTGLQNQLVGKAAASPGERRRVFSGFPTQGGFSSGGYWSGFTVTDAKQFLPGGTPFEKPVVFIINSHGELPQIALALQASHQAAIISEGIASDASVVTTHHFDAGEGVTIEYRLGELQYADGSTGLQVDTVLQATGLHLSEEAVNIAVTRAKRPTPHVSQSPELHVVTVQQIDRPYAEMRYPSLPYRLLAAARIWSVFDYFYPYAQLIRTDWDSVLAESLPYFEFSRDSIEYGLAIARMTAYSHDSHTRAMNSPIMSFYGTGRPPFVVQFIQHKAVVTHLLDSASCAKAGIIIGDIVTSVDNENIEARMRRYTPYVAASTPQSLLSSLAGFLVRGPEGSIGSYVLQKADGKTRTVQVLRTTTMALKNWRSGDVIKILPGNIGYVDLERLPVARVDNMFETFKNTSAIIFDGRGYPQGTAWHIAPRLTERFEPVAAMFSRPVVVSPHGSDGSLAGQKETFSFTQPIPATDKWRYKGATVLLIDEKAISQAEHTGLFLKAATNITFIGSNTAGANGDVTTIVLPGGISVWMTGHNVQWPDGRQLQRVGLVPDIEVRPTIKGVRAGRDEVLEAAMTYLKGKSKH